MRHLLTMSAIGACGLVMAGCATTDNYASACERDYAENRNRAMAADPPVSPRDVPDGKIASAAR